jgi:hypothetical protein
MADVQVGSQADELAVALVSALAQQDGEQALALSLALAPLVDDRPALAARHAAWTAQAHLLRGDMVLASTEIKRAIALAQGAGELDAVPALRQLETRVTQASATPLPKPNLPLPDTTLGHACKALDAGEFAEGARLARAARTQAQAAGDFREEVLALLALARVPGQEDSAIRAAYRAADASDDRNLITAVAKAAKVASIALPTQIF